MKIVSHIACFVMVMVIASGCGPKEPSQPKYDVHPVIVDDDLAPYASRFEDDIGRSTAGISMGFGDLSGNVVGQCTIQGPNKTILILKSFWDASDDYQREQLMYHELGHCALGLGHVSDLRQDDNCPISIMYPNVLGACYKTHQADYILDLRSRI